MLKVVRLFKLAMTALAVVSVISCSPAKKTSTLSIVLPSAHNQKISRSLNPGTIDYTKACFAVNVVASDIPSQAINCGPKVGIFSGFIASGSSSNSTVNLEVPMGTGRKIEIYYFNRNSSGDSCPTNFGASTPDNFAMIGSKSDVDTSQAQTSVDITVAAPGVGDSLVSELGLPVSCIASSTNGAKAGHVALGSVNSTSAGGYTISGQVTSSKTNNELTSSGGYTMYLGPKAQ